MKNFSSVLGRKQNISQGSGTPKMKGESGEHSSLGPLSIARLAGKPALPEACSPFPDSELDSGQNGIADVERHRDGPATPSPSKQIPPERNSSDLSVFQTSSFVLFQINCSSVLFY